MTSSADAGTLMDGCLQRNRWKQQLDRHLGAFDLVRYIVLAGALALLASGQNQQPGQQKPAALPDAPQQQQQAIPDGPRPQSTLPDSGAITPGKGTTPASSGDLSSKTITHPDDQQVAPGTTLQSTTPTVHPDDDAAPELPAPGQAPQVFTIRGAGINFVEVPFTVKDSKNQPVPGIGWRDVRVFENGYRQHLDLFTVDPFPLSVAFVIDQSVPFDIMTKINNALGALTGAFTPYDEVAVITYNNGPKMETDFTAAQSARLSAVLERSKGKGRDPVYYDPTGPMGQTNTINGYNVDPNTSPNRSAPGITLQVPKEVHTLNDAILMAANATTKTPKGRRRIVYVVSDGKEYGSTAKQKDVIKYCQQNQVAVYATVVGESAVPGIGFMDRMHLPLFMRDNVLPTYANATGGQIDNEFRQGGIEKSFARITEEVRTQYTVGYISHEPFVDGKYRSIEVIVLRPGLTVISKKGYFPTAEALGPPRNTLPAPQ
jgi:VWFA-related protein